MTDPGHAHGSGSIAFMNWACTTQTGLGFTSGGQYSTNAGCANTISGLLGAPATAGATTGLTEGTAGGNETRPKNVAVNYIIKI